MLTLNQLISEAATLPDAEKAILIDHIAQSLTEQIEPDILREGVRTAQERLTAIETGTVQTIPGEVALAQVRQLFQP